jgi:hypothetical protein
MRTGFCLGKPNGKDHLEDLGVEGMIIQKCIVGKWNGGQRLDLSGSG